MEEVWSTVPITLSVCSLPVHDLGNGDEHCSIVTELWERYADCWLNLLFYQCRWLPGMRLWIPVVSCRQNFTRGYMFYRRFFFFSATIQRVTRPPITTWYKVYQCLEPMCGANNSYRHLPTRPCFSQGTKRAKFVPFLTPLTFWALWFKSGSKNKEIWNEGV